MGILIFSAFIFFVVLLFFGIKLLVAILFKKMGLKRNCGKDWIRKKFNLDEDDF